MFIHSAADPHSFFHKEDIYILFISIHKSETKMSYEIPEPLEPVLESQLTPELQVQFFSLLQEIRGAFFTPLDPEAIQAAAALLHETLEQVVSANPILAQAVSNDGQWSLLDLFCAVDNSASFETIKFLTKTNPHALLWCKPNMSGPIQLIAGIPNCDLLPWIAENYPWVFVHEASQKNPPHLHMILCYLKGGCDLKTVRKFYELYPRGLQEKHGNARDTCPLWLSLKGPDEPEGDLFIWMAKQYPEAVSYVSTWGTTLLHQSCDSLAARKNTRDFKCTRNMANICQFLISEHPDLIRQPIRGCEYLPIHALATRCNRPLVQEMVILLLKAYPECVLAEDEEEYPELSTVPFIQQVHPLIVNQLEIDQDISLLAQISQNMTTANSSALSSSLFSSVSEVFCSWANLQVFSVLPARKNRIQDRIADICRDFEADDIESDDEDESVGGDEFNDGEEFDEEDDSGDDDD